MIHQLLYASGALPGTGHRDIRAILDVSRRNNAAEGISGLLLYTDETFVQMLEGERQAVQTVAARIRRDPRHRNMMILVQRDVPARAFGDWHMGFQRLDRDLPADNTVFELSRTAIRDRIAPDQSALLGVIGAFAGLRHHDA